MFHVSPSSRRESTPLLDKVKIDASLASKAKTAILHEQDDKKKKPKKVNEELPMLKYLDTQVIINGFDVHWHPGKH